MKRDLPWLSMGALVLGCILFRCVVAGGEGSATHEDVPVVLPREGTKNGDRLRPVLLSSAVDGAAPVRLMSAGADAVCLVARDRSGRLIPGLALRWRQERAVLGVPSEPVLNLGYEWRASGLTTDESGSVEFSELDGGGQVRFALGQPPAWGYAISEVVALEENWGATLHLTVEAPPRERLIAGVVSGPNGDVRPDAQVRYFWSSASGVVDVVSCRADIEGRFFLLPQAGARGGVLLASAHDGSAVMRPVGAGDEGLVMQLPSSRYVEVRALGTDGEVVRRFTADLEYEILGVWVRDYFRIVSSHDRPAKLAVPVVPFRLWVNGQVAGPFHPESVGDVIVMRVGDLEGTEVSGRVTALGQAVPYADVVLTPVDRSSAESAGYSVQTNVRGEFRQSVKPGRYSAEAWSDRYGAGCTGKFEVDDVSPVSLDIVITDAPATLYGLVSLPEGRSPHEVWLALDGESSYFRVSPDGQYEISCLRPGLSVLRVVGGVGGVAGVGDAAREDALLRAYGPPGVRIRLKRAPSDAPSWMGGSVGFAASLVAGERRRVDIDLADGALCSLHGSVSALDLNGELGDMSVRLLVPESRSVEGGSVVAVGRVDRSGRFEVGVLTPGRFLLEFTVANSGAVTKFRELLDVAPGGQRWELRYRTGVVRVILGRDQGARMPDGLQIRGGLGACDVVVGSPEWGDAPGVYVFSHVPEGDMQLFLRRDGQWVECCDVVVVGGATTEVLVPRE